MENRNNCKWCDFICENKQKGIICFNPKSDNFNQRIDLKDSCEHIEFNYYIHPKDDEPGLFDD